MENTRMYLRYNKEPPRVKEENRREYTSFIWRDSTFWCGDEYGYDEQIWERWSLPLGCGHIGASVFGYTDTERIIITENSLANPYRSGGKSPQGVNTFAEILIDTGHTNVNNYLRELSLDDATLTVSYGTEDGVRHKREYFTSYPAAVMAMRFSADKCGGVSLFTRVNIPHLHEEPTNDEVGFAKLGRCECDGSLITIRGEMEYYGIKYEGQLKVLAKGAIPVAEGGGIRVTGADEVVLIFAAGTNYRLESRVFLESDPKKKLAPYPHPHGRVTHLIEDAEKQGYARLYEEHLEDYHSLYKRVSLYIGEPSPLMTDELLGEYKKGKESRYLEALIYQYGRYLLICSSRQGCLPANLQGIWNMHDQSPWSAGYWHNINVQMNYWPSGIANLAECFLSYSDYNQAYMAAARANADAYVEKHRPDRLAPKGENGWIIATGGWPYRMEGFDKIGHSGPGTGAFTSLLFWDYYDYTRDEDYLRRVCYPVLREMSIFFSKALVERDGALLVSPSASPEIMVNGSYHHTEGCAFDQEMVYENYKRTLEAANILGISEPIIDTIKRDIDRLQPVLIGKSGQIKEFREEEYYGEFGEYRHRHVSQLVGMYPGTLINAETPEWIDAAKVTLTERGDKSHGWAMAHRLCLWTRAGCADRAITLVRAMINNSILENLWNTHPPFQIDGNFGYTAGVSEMLLQSQAGFIEPLPALPKEWSEGSYNGLVARGNFTVDCKWEKCKPTYVKITSNKGGTVRLKANGLDTAEVYKNGAPLSSQIAKDGIFTAPSDNGDEFVFKFK